MINLKKSIFKKIDKMIQYYTKESMSEQISRYRSLGVKIGENVVLYDVTFDAVYPYLLTIGNNVTITGALILCHDDSLILFNGKRLVAPVTIGDHVFIGRGAIVLPNLTIGSNVIIGAGAVVTKDIPDGSVVAGNPGKVISTVEELVKKKEQKGFLLQSVFDSNFVTDNKHELVREKFGASEIPI